MNKYKFSIVYKILVYPVTVVAFDEEEAHIVFNDKMSVKIFPSNEEIKYLGEEFYSSWDIESVEAFCANCGEIPEWVGSDDLEDNYTICPRGCYIAH